MSEKRVYKHGHGSDAQHKADQALFSHLLEQHHQLHRTTELLPNGIRSITTADTAELATVLQQHVAGMEKRFGMGRAIRSWDPLFAALFEYRDQIEMEYRNVDMGVEAILTADNPKLVALIQCHDQTLHQFVDYGYQHSGDESPMPDWLAKLEKE